MIFLFVVIISQSKSAFGGFLPTAAYPYLLIIGMLLMATSLLLELRRERKHKDFTIFLYTRKILRTLAGLGIAVYYLTIV